MRKKNSKIFEIVVPGAGFEPAKHYAEDLESTPFDRSGTPALGLPSMAFFLTIPLGQHHPNRTVAVEEGPLLRTLRTHRRAIACVDVASGLMRQQLQ